MFTLTAPPGGPSKSKDPALRRGLLHSCFALGSQLVFVLTALTALLAGPVALALRILLLLSGFLAAALLLPGALLAGVLILLTRILVLLARLLTR